ncbi:hypothetical protein [Spirosoma endophyticum]|nr:hypothetical protein [Spirosoma endophyticum]
MKKNLCLIGLVSASIASYGQRIESSIQVGSGLFSYRGPNSVNETGLNANGNSFISNPYGRASGASYSLSGQIQSVTKCKLIYGIQVGYEQLTSRVAITKIIGDFSNSPTNGRGSLQNQYVNLSPFVGKRFGDARFSVDATLGLDAAIGLRSRESWMLDTYNSSFQTPAAPSQRIPDVDFRPRLNLTGYYKAFGLSAGYSYGLSNYLANRYTDAKVYSQFWRAGVVYRIKK